MCENPGGMVVVLQTRALTEVLTEGTKFISAPMYKENVLKTIINVHRQNRRKSTELPNSENVIFDRGVNPFSG